MAKCELCGLDMLTAKGCTIGKLHVGKKVYSRFRVSSGVDRHSDTDKHNRCHDCNALIGEYHHWGCDMERCPACGLQLISCDCEDVYALGRNT